MANNIQASLRSVAAASEPMTTQERIGMLQKAILTIQHQLRDLNKQLQATSDVQARMALEHEITELTQMEKSLEQQILLLQQMEERRKQMSENRDMLAGVAVSAAGAVAAPSASQGAGTAP